RGVGEIERAVGLDGDVAGLVVDGGGGVEGQRAVDRGGAGVGDGVVVDLGGAADREGAGIVERAVGVDDQVTAGGDRDGAGVGGADVVQRVAGVAGVEVAGVAQRAVGDDAGALQVEGAVEVDGERACGGAAGLILVDGGVGEIERAVGLDGDVAGLVVDGGGGVEGERAVDRDGAGVGDGVVVDLGGAADREAAGIVERAVGVDDQVGAGGDRDGAGVGGADVVQRVAGAEGIELRGIVQDAVRQHTIADQIEGAVVGNGAAVD